MANIDIHGKDETALVNRIAELINEARQRTVTAVNTAMVYTYYEIGRMIVEDEQGGEERAYYGTAMLKNVAKKLTIQFGKGFSYTNLEQMRKFYKVYSQIPQTLSEELQVVDNNVYSKFALGWSHYLKLMRIENADERRFYEIEATNNHWSLRELERQYDSSLHERFDLKRGKLKHQDIGQMQMYVNYYDCEMKLDDENPTIGILLCADKSDAVVQYTLPADNNQIFASKYRTVLLTKEELKRLLMDR